MTLEQWSYYAAVVSAVLALIVFPFVGWQLVVARAQRRDAIRLSTSQVLLAVDAVLATHQQVAAHLRRGWVDKDGNQHPTTDELPLVEPYLGVFERIFIAYQAGQVDAETLDQLYGYRLARIWANQPIVEWKLQNQRLRTSWKRLIALTYVIEAERGKRFPFHTDKYFPSELFTTRAAANIKKKSQA